MTTQTDLADPASSPTIETHPTIAEKTTDTGEGKVYPPASNPAAVVIGVILGVAFLGLAAVAIRDLLIHVGWVDSDEWSVAAADRVADMSWATWMWPAAVALIVVGLWLVWLAIRPRRTTHLSVDGFEVLWTRRGDIARRCSAAVSAVPGVEHATTVVGRRKVKLTVTADSDRFDESAVQHVVDGVLSGIVAPLRATISVRRRGNAAEGGNR